ncbi:hypothetical protein MRB53_038758 [Persea americana]|nr:hypothetical protein MRB53_038758 [Persea americana]
MGKATTASSSKALAIQVDESGKVKYDAIARRGHSDNRFIHTSFKELIPLRQRADAGEISLEKPSEEEAQAAKERTQKALQGLVDGALAAQKPKNIKGTSRPEPTYVRYTPSNQMGDTSKKQDRIMKIVQRQQDPVEPPKHKIKKVPRGPPSPPPPVMHSPPRKLTAEDQEAWRIPPPVSNWKNPKGYTVPLDKDWLLMEEGCKMLRSMIGSHNSQKLYILRIDMLEKKCNKDSRIDDHLDREVDLFIQDHRTLQNLDLHQEMVMIEEIVSELEKKDDVQRNEKCNRRIWVMKDVFKCLLESRIVISVKKWLLDWLSQLKAKKQCTTVDCSTRALASTQVSNEDQHYDKPLFAQRDALNSIYRPITGADEDEGDDGGETLERITGEKRFDALGRAPKEGFKGTEATEARSGPVMFERDRGDDPFGVDAMIAEAAQGAKKRPAMDDAAGSSKRARADDD